MNTNPQILTGNWKEGYALDLHTLSSTPKEWESTKKIQTIDVIDGKIVIVEKDVPEKVTKWNTVYTPIGEEMNHLKYWKEQYRAKTIGQCAVEFLTSKLDMWNVDVIIPVPPSDTTRQFQPVYEIAKYIGNSCNITVDFEILNKTKSTSQIKQIDDVNERKELLKGAFAIEMNSLLNKNVIVFDDLFRSGETLRTICDVVINKAKARNVFVLTITKTRTKK